jgi:hypothetical protein
MESANVLRELLDRQEILDCILRYCRGLDRSDRNLVCSAFHPDALLDQGTFAGLGRDMYDWLNPLNQELGWTTVHSVQNHLIELDGDVAHAETYAQAYSTTGQDQPLNLFLVRYIDRFERRNGRWAIAARVITREAVGQIAPTNLPAELDSSHYRKGRRDRTDLSYERPLVIRAVGDVTA